MISPRRLQRPILQLGQFQQNCAAVLHAELR
jgi:hypothetical protein